MSDILKFIRNEQAQQDDPHGRLMDLPEWSLKGAQQTAKQLGIAELTADHWDVIHKLRSHVAEGGDYRHARKLMEVMDLHVAAKGGRKFLYQLFPGGPVTQGMQIAGLPVPEDSTDSSFGTTM